MLRRVSLAAALHRLFFNGNAIDDRVVHLAARLPIPVKGGDAGVVGELAQLTVRQLHELTIDQIEAPTALPAG